MRLITWPGVFEPRSDSWLLAELVRDRARPGDLVLDPFAGSGVLALAAAQAGAEATAIDISRRAVWCTRANAVLNRLRVRAIRGDGLDAVGDARFDLLVANPPYLPGGALPARGAARAWEGGPDGRRLIDRLCAQAGGRLRPGGRLLLVHSSVCGESRTLNALAAGGLDGHVLGRRRGPFGPLLAARRRRLEATGLCAPGQAHEDVLLFEGRRGG
jgi:release factor glutamine methyltransferase